MLKLRQNIQTNLICACRKWVILRNCSFVVSNEMFITMTDHDQEKEMFKIKRRMGAFHSQGAYQDALKCALDMETKVSLTIGEKNAVYASCLNNIALMQKLLGLNEEAMKNYTISLQLYGDVLGKKHASYASALANIGLFYKSCAEVSKGIEKFELLQRAEEASQDALDIRTEAEGPSGKNAILSSINLSTVWKAQNKLENSEELLRSTLELARKTFGNADLTTATILNNLGLLLKQSKRLDAARLCYDEARTIRSNILGDKHPDTIIVMHNIAELLLATGNVTAASALQREILQLMSHHKHVSAQDLQSMQDELNNTNHDDNSEDASNATSTSVNSTSNSDSNSYSENESDSPLNNSIIKTIQQVSAAKPVGATYSSKPKARKFDTTNKKKAPAISEWTPN